MKKPFIILLVFFSQQLCAATLTAQTDRYHMGEDETLNLTITYDEASVSGQPDLKGLQSNFEVIGSTSNSQTRIINGHIDSTKSWRYTLLPKHSGKLLIPSFELKGSYSEAIEIDVSSSTNTRPSLGENRGDLFIETTIDKKKAYVQEMVTLTLKIYTSVNISRPKLQDLSLPGFMVEKMADSEYETQYNGRTYYVLQYQYALFATQSGSSIIPKQRYQIAQIISNGPRNMFNIPGFENTQARFLSTPEIFLEITASPDQRPAPYWLVAEDVSISDNWKDKQTIEQGTPITRTIQINALNALSSHIPPLPEPEIKGIKVYPEPAELNNTQAADKLRASRKENSAIVATDPGTYTFPELTIHWWNSKTKQFSTSVLPARTLAVTPSAASGNTISTSPQQIPETNKRIQPAVAAPSADTSLPPFPQVSPALRNPWYLNPYGWMGLSSMLFILLIAAVLALLKNKQSTSNDVVKIDSSQQNQSLKDDFKYLKKACQQNDAVATRTALLRWASNYKIDKTILSLHQAAELFNNDEFNQLIEELDSAIYKQAGTWNGTALLNFLQQHPLENTPNGKKNKAVPANLAGLYD